MATVKVKFRASSIEAKEGTLYYQVIHKRQARQVHAGYKVYPREWDPAKSGVILNPDMDNDRRAYLMSVETAVSDDLSRIKSIIARLDGSGCDYSSAKVIEAFHSAEWCVGFISFARQLTDNLKQIGRRRTSETYSTVINSFSRFRKNRDILFDQMDSILMCGYESYLKGIGICPNSTSFYMRNLRAIYNLAVEKDLTMQRFPFKHVYTGIDKTVKRAVTIKTIRQIRELDLSQNPSAEEARDLFMFSFYTRGMSFIDMAYLKKTDIKNGILSYRRHKTGQQLCIKWEKPMQEIVDKYDTSSTPYLLPIIIDSDADERLQYKNAAHRINSWLKKIGRQIGLSVPLTSYVARHSWASAAKAQGIPLSVISEGMGHDSESTTRIYLASLETSVVDKANSIILKSL